MRQQTFQKALSRLTDTGFRLFFVTGLVFAVLTGLYNIWLCMAELVILLVLYLYFQSGAIRRKQEAMDYLDHLASGVDNASRRTMLSSPMPIAIFRPDFIAVEGDILYLQHGSAVFVTRQNHRHAVHIAQLGCGQLRGAIPLIQQIGNLHIRREHIVLCKLIVREAICYAGTGTHLIVFAALAPVAGAVID